MKNSSTSCVIINHRHHQSSSTVVVVVRKKVITPRNLDSLGDWVGTGKLDASQSLSVILVLQA